MIVYGMSCFRSPDIQAAVLGILKLAIASLTTEEAMKMAKIMALIREHSPAKVRLPIYEVAAEAYNLFKRSVIQSIEESYT